MAIGGRKPLPAEDKEARGNPGGRPIPDTPNFTPGSDLAPPKRWKKKPGYEREEWDRIVPELQTCGIAKAIHQGMLEKICELYAASVLLYQAKDYAGSRMAVGEYRKALNEFGLTAASAGRVGFLGGDAAKKEEADPTAEFFGRPKLAS